MSVNNLFLLSRAGAGMSAGRVSEKYTVLTLTVPSHCDQVFFSTLTSLAEYKLFTPNAKFQFI